MEVALPPQENIKEHTAVKTSRQLSVLAAKAYPVIVTDAFIDYNPKNNYRYFS